VRLVWDPVRNADVGRFVDGDNTDVEITQQPVGRNPSTGSID
jgi:hypothetical protein